MVGGLNLSRQTTRELQAPRNIYQCELSQRSSSQHQEPDRSNGLQAPVLDGSGQTTSKTGTHHPSTTMRRQRNMLQTKEQGKNLQDQINEVEIGNRPEKEFRVMRANMIQNLRNRMEA